MNETELAKAKMIRNGMIIVSVILCLLGMLALFYPSSDSGIIRIASSVSCFGAAILWVLPSIKRLSFSTCLHALVGANFIMIIGATYIHRLMYSTRWHSIYHEVGKLNNKTPFDFDQFGSFLSHALRSGYMIIIGIIAVWILNLLALIYLAQSERDKEKADEKPSCQNTASPH